MLLFFILTIMTSLSNIKSTVGYPVTSESDRLIDLLNYDAVPSFQITEILSLKLSNLNQTCLKENAVEKKIKIYKEKLDNIFGTLHPERRNHTLNEDKVLSMNIWHNLFNITHDIENCFPGGYSLKPFEKWNLVFSVSTEIAKRIEYQNLLSYDDARCLHRKSPKIYSCHEQKVETEESLFFILLSGLRPQFGLCDENLEAKMCYLRIIKSCNNPDGVTAFKHLLSPPGSTEPCENLKSFQ